MSGRKNLKINIKCVYDKIFTSRELNFMNEKKKKKFNELLKLFSIIILADDLTS